MKKESKKRIKYRKKESEKINIKNQILSILFYEIMGFLFCLFVLFILSGGRNYIKLYRDLNKLINVYDYITSDYYGKINKKELVDNAIESMMDSVGDDFTTYADKKNTSDFLENIGGSYEGIGCLVSMDKNNNIYVVNIFEDSPAEKAGLKTGDIITKVDGIDYKEKTSSDMAEYVKNSKKEKVKLTIKRDEKVEELTLVRKKLEVPSVTSKVVEKNERKIGYIDISIFSAVTYNQFNSKLKALEKEKIEGLVIDLRNDTGGYLDIVTDITSLFLEKGQIIYQLEDKNKKTKVKDRTKEKREYPIAVLINGSSASASEILASAIKENYKYNSFIVGTNSYGKGTVQKTKKLPDGSMIKYTTQNWLTPKGNWINEKGVEPTDYIEYDKNSKNDNQLDLALELINKTIK